ncbi:MAG: helix-turn-helix transcriptional regulator [Bacillota bacterium]|nr:helix-turn-helix transcriptional regulator [Bacillota bacterium]
MLLDSLTKNNAFISRTDNVYRYHLMLQQCTRHHFSQKPLEYQQRSHTSLGDWFMEQGDYLQAYYSYAKAQNYGKILSCIEADRCLSLNGEHAEDFFSWIANCPEETRLAYPSALTISMLAMFSFNNIPELKRLKALLLKSLDLNTSLSEEDKNNLLGDAEISESLTAYNNISAMSEYHRRACALLTRPTYSVDPNDAWTFGSPSILMMYHRTVGLADTESEEMTSCMPYYYRVTGGHGNGAELVFQAELHYERGNFIDAEIANKIAMSAARRDRQYSIMLAGEFLNMRLELLRGNFNRIEAGMNELRELFRREKQYTLLSTLDICQVFIASMLARPQDAPEWLAEGRLSETLTLFPAMPMLNTYYNQMLLAGGEYTELIARREECQELYGVFNNVLCIVWLHIQLAVALGKIDRPDEAVDELRAALALALPDGMIMPFAENWIWLSDLSSRLSDEEKHPAYLDEISRLAEMVQSGRKKILETYFSEPGDYGLSDRELEIARLASQRLTTAEIAEKLHLSPGTVQNHLSRIFSKLEISGTGKNKRLELEKFFAAPDP